MPLTPLQKAALHILPVCLASSGHRWKDMLPGSGKNSKPISDIGLLILRTQLSQNLSLIYLLQSAACSIDEECKCISVISHAALN